jgi:uncharacterized OB-fold protein
MADTTYTGPIPKPTPETRPYWEAAKQRRLLFQACDDCGARYFYPRPLCPGCLSRAVRWVEASGRARLHTFVINHRPPRHYPVAGPFVIGMVELEEGPRMMSHIVEVAADPQALRCDMPLEVVFEDITPEITLAKFRPRAAA